MRLNHPKTIPPPHPWKNCLPRNLDLGIQIRLRLLYRPTPASFSRPEPCNLDLHHIHTSFILTVSTLSDTQYAWDGT